MSEKPKGEITVDFPSVARFLGVTSGYIGKLHYFKKKQREEFLALLQESDFTVYKIREETRQPWLAVYFKDDGDHNLFRLMFGGSSLHQVYRVRQEDEPAYTFISANPLKKSND